MAKPVTTTFLTRLDVAASIERLSIVLDLLQRETQDTSKALGTNDTCVVRRRGPLQASVWLSDGPTETSFTVTLAADPDGTNVTVAMDPLRWRGRKIPRYVTRKLLHDDPGSIMVREWFDPDIDPTAMTHLDMPMDATDDGFIDPDAPYLDDWDRPVDPDGQALRVEVLTAVESPTAIDAPGVATAVSKKRRLAMTLLVGAIASSAVMIAYGIRGAQREHLLDTEGVDTTATVIEVPHGDSDDLIIRYDTPAGAERYTYFDPEHDYEVGDDVDVRYIQGEDLVEIDREFRYDASTSDPSVMGFFVAIVLWPCAVRTAWRSRVLRRSLEETPFRIASVTDHHIDTPSRVLLALLIDGDREDPVKVRRPTFSLKTNELSGWGTAARFGRILIAGDHPRRRVALALPGRPYVVVMSRIPLRRRYWRWRARQDM